jgi:hypothetical protein
MGAGQFAEGHGHGEADAGGVQRLVFKRKGKGE